jgi:outer membrane lipoprotein-sorting protein
MIRSLALLALAVAAVPAGAATGREIIDQAQQKHGFSTWKDRSVETTMTTYSGGTITRARDIEINEQTDPRGEHRTFMNFTGPADVQGTRFLHLSPRGAADQQWLYTPTVRRVRRLGEAQRDENFFGADLSYRDLELLVRIQQWNDAESTATLAEKTEVVDGHPCHVVTLMPKNEEFPSYSKYTLWFGTEDALLWRVEIFDTDGKLFKRVSPKGYERIGKYATAMNAEIETVPNDTRTAFVFKEVKYDVGVPDGVFAVSNLDR